MHQNEIEAKMNKQIGVSMKALDWFILQGFLKNIIESEDLVKANFKSAEDCTVIECILDKIQKQFAPHLEDNTSEIEKLENVLKLPPKKIITKKDIIY